MRRLSISSAVLAPLAGEAADEGALLQQLVGGNLIERGLQRQRCWLTSSSERPGSAVQPASRSSVIKFPVGNALSLEMGWMPHEIFVVIGCERLNQ